MPALHPESDETMRTNAAGPADRRKTVDILAALAEFINTPIGRPAAPWEPVEPARLSSAAYDKHVTATAARMGVREQDLAYTVALAAAMRLEQVAS